MLGRSFPLALGRRLIAAAWTELTRGEQNLWDTLSGFPSDLAG